MTSSKQQHPKFLLRVLFRLFMTKPSSQAITNKLDSKNN